MKNSQGSVSEKKTILLHKKKIESSEYSKITLSENVINEEPRGNHIVDLSRTNTYDLRNVHYINNTGLAHMIELKRNALKNGIQIYFINVGDNVRSKIQAMGIIHLFNC